jgi:hypothetical protein
MTARLLALCLAPAMLLPAAPKKTVATARGENEDLVLTATLYLDGPAVKQAVGDDMGGQYIVVDVKVEPKYGKEISIDRDDFTLRTDKDGERSRPMSASEIAGRGALIVSQAGEAPRTGGGVQMGSPYPYPGGYPGGYPPMGGPPVMMPGGVGVGTGGGGGDSGEVPATARSSAQDKENPLEKVLAGKMLQDGKTDKPAVGLLYFAMDKQKMKDLELLYGGRENRISLRFK